MEDIPGWLLKYLRLHSKEGKMIFLVVPLESSDDEETEVISYSEMFMHFSKLCQRHSVDVGKIKSVQPHTVVDLVTKSEGSSWLKGLV